MPTDKRPLRFVIIGAGMAGMLAGIRLKERGDTDFTIYEKGDTVGGTWRENSYPGLACDTPAHSYTFSFATNPEWSAFYAPGPEIRAYFEDIADRYDLKSQISFNTEIASCRFVDGRWRIVTTDGRDDVADVVIAATGVLHHPAMPDIPGLASFAGPYFHSARWDHSVGFDGKRIGVIGNGSTGVQIVSALSKIAGTLVHFQRSPQWIMPCPDLKYSDADKQAFRDDPAKIEAVRNGPEASARRARFTAAIIDLDSPELAEIQEIVERNLQDSIRDPDLREKLRPDYRAACKRMVFSAHYYNAVQRPNVEVAVGTIERVEAAGIRMKDGSFHELDVIALATGFRVDQFVRPMIVEGVGGQSLDVLWAEHPRAYYAVAVPDFPNFFLLNGPTGPVGNFTLIDIAEAQWTYIDQLIDLLRAGTCDAVAPSRAALENYEERRTEAAKRTVFASGCRSWYLDKQGVPQVWPWSYAYFQHVMATPNLDDYDLIQRY
ncbi:flavin-containing monooxygenase [Sphingomonas psychrolutea]|uniref:Monooxygenase n=1 Tax=Sphingomonas psychrolutea TaxID=1259676 RepID=A0ABQ1G6A8_9SPHN|nr:NAD(P)/FAD-dependent oxidoreductase [Sphingomonas psychrolutea]GGA37606.1 putative monooxygenase [Sphingomonas psychrolutea]